mmetsp:Transcript_1275/g.3096  ORF Transcript_1275/g.3096 Transcript_1275/m.3096 type:complete len:537 (-) Transcript_1275:1041-2651(-)
MVRPSSTALTMVEKSSSASTMSEASFETAVPVPIATPMAACCRAGASLTPSPVIAGISFRSSWSILMRACLSEGWARQKTMLPLARMESCSSLGFRKNSCPSKALSDPSSSSPLDGRTLISLAIATAVSRASPVMTMTRIPASVHLRMLSATSGRAGSLIPTRPTSVKPLSMDSYREGSDSSGCSRTSLSPSGLKVRRDGGSRSSFVASARHRSGRAAMSVTVASSSLRRDPVIFATLPSRYLTWVHRSSTMLAAPLTSNRFRACCFRFFFPPPLAKSARTDMLFRSRWNSRVADFGCRSRHRSTWRLATALAGRRRPPRSRSSPSSSSSRTVPSFSASTHRAASVGSPFLSKAFVVVVVVVVLAPSSSSHSSLPTIVASLQREATANTSQSDDEEDFVGSVEEESPGIRPIGEYETPSTVYSTAWWLRRVDDDDVRRPSSSTSTSSRRLFRRRRPSLRSRSRTTREDTVISLVVRVPVLSLQITETHPSVSTLGRFRTMTFLRAIRLVPRLRHNVMTAGNPSGIAATPNATATFA